MTDDDSFDYSVVMNHEDQYSIWPADLDIPAGWQGVGRTGPKADCLAYIETVWTDMRPRSLRRWMDEQGLEEQEWSRRQAAPPRDPPRPRAAARFRATSVQRAMIVDSLRAPVRGVDVIQVLLTRTGRLDRTVFEAAWRDTAARHDTLRSTFGWHRDHGVRQQVHDRAAANVDWVELDPGHPDEPQVDAFVTADRVRGFDISAGPLFRVSVLSGGSSGETIVVTFHHAIVDGRSIVILLREVFDRYESRRAGRVAVPLPETPPFQRFAAWWARQDQAAARDYWTSQLAGLPSLRPLAGHRSQPPRDRSTPVTVVHTLTAAESDAVRACAAAAGVPTSAMVHAAWGLVLARHTSSGDVVFAVTRSSRWHSVPGAEHLVGPLVNTVPLRLRIAQDDDVRRLLAEVRTRALEDRRHQVAPVAEILEWAGQQPDAPQLETLVVVERASLQARLHESHAALRGTRVRTLRQLSFPLALYVFDEPRIQLDLMVDESRFNRATAEEIVAQFRHALLELARDPDASVGSIRLEPADRPRAIHDLDHAPAPPYPREQTVPDLFAAQVATRPSAPAVTAGDTTVTYADLDRRSERLARVLREHGVVTDQVVGVALPRGLELVVALLAVVKAGAAYLPLEPDSPPSRTGALLAAAGARLVLTTHAWPAEIPPGDATTLHVDRLPATDAAPAPATAPGGPAPAGPHPLSTAYISFTSGSTGTPKGVAVPHRAVVRLVHEPNFATLGPAETLLHAAPAAFDATTWEVWGALLTGGHLVVAPPGPLDLATLAQVIREHRVSTLWLTAGLFGQLVELDPGALAGVRQLLSGGDVLPADAVRAALRAQPGRWLVNGYGPTENTTFTTCHRMQDPDNVPDRVPIGRPVQQTSVYVLDERLAPVPIGVTGELYTGGDGVARGYVARPGPTAERFVPDPFGATPGGRLYRTGDLVRWRADGLLEFVGRVDDQVKIRGFRVEPREVEGVLREHSAVHEAAVVVRGEGLGRHLVGFVTPRGATDDGPLPELLLEYAARRLPPYLVPGAVLVLDRLPLRPNGKVDRSALPPVEPPGVERPDSELPAGTPPPRTPTEHRLARLWQEVLPGVPVAGEADFVAAGGNSLAVIRLLFLIHEEFGIRLDLPDFYGASTLTACARAIDQALARPVRDLGITRRHPAAVPAPESGAPAPAVPLASHRIRLTDEWALWDSVCVRSAGLPFGLVDTLAEPALADLADQANQACHTGEDEPAYLAAYAAAVRRLSGALATAGRDPAVREAVAWQNRHALGTGIDPLLRRDLETGRRNRRDRQHEALLGSYLQRYCAKNDTIGFFGPVGWSRLDEAGSGPTIRHGQRELASRTVHLERWAVERLLRRYEPGLLADLAPRRLPHLELDGDRIRVPLGGSVELSPTERAVLHACDGLRTARQVAAAITATLPSVTVADVYDALTALVTARRLAWRLEIPPDDAHPERTARALLSVAAASGERSAALAALDELEAGRDALAAAAGDADAVAGAMADLERVFVRHTDAAPSRRPGELYAGRTLAYEECQLGASVELGTSLLDGVRDALGAVLTGARWFTAAGAALYGRLLRELFESRVAATGSPSVPFTDLWLLATDLLFDPPADLVRPLTRALAQRWAKVLQLPPSGERHVRLTGPSVAERARAVFEVAAPGWPAAVHHSPDLMLLPSDPAAMGRGDVDWVLGELHPGVNTLRYRALVAHHGAPGSLRAAMAADLPSPAVWAAPTAETGGVPARQSNRLAAEDDWRLVFAHDTVGVDDHRALRPADLVVVDDAGTLRVRSRDDRVDLRLLEVLGDVIAGALVQHFRVVPRTGAHTPRVQVDRLVVSRERWAFLAGNLPFVRTRDEARRYREARAWAGAHGLPRRVFLRSTGEAKPVYLDLTSPVSVDLLARAVRRADRVAGHEARIDLTEMLPGPEHLWLTDRQGRPHTAELRLVAVDERAKGPTIREPTIEEPTIQEHGRMSIHDTQPLRLAASAAQRRLWLVDRMDPGLPTYNVPWAVGLDGAVDPAALAAALTAVTSRHEALRTTLHATLHPTMGGDDALHQVVAPAQRPVELPVVDLRSSGDPAAAVRTHVERASRRRFDLARGPLFAAELLTVTDTSHVLVLVAHHVVADGWSFRILFDELATDYAAALGAGESVPEPPIQYADFARWQGEQAGAGALDGAERYWVSELAGVEPVLELPSERRRPAAQSFDGGFLDFALGAARTAAVRRLAAAHRTTPFTVLLAVHALLLGRLTGREDIVVAVPVSGRVRPETSRVVGPFMNTLPIRVRIGAAPTFAALVGQLSATMVRALEHQDMPFERIVELVRPPRDGARSPLVQVMFQLEELPARRRSGGVDWSPELVDNRTSKLDLTLTMVDGPDELAGRLCWATAVLDEEEARDHVEAYRALLDTVVGRPGQPLAVLDGLSPRQRAAVTGTWADGGPAVAAGTDILDLLERALPGSRSAVSASGPELSPAGPSHAGLSVAEMSGEALLDQASRIAATLTGLGLGPDQHVGLCLSRGTPMLAALLGVWWSGASYVPLDPAYPTERLRAMLTDAAPRAVLTDAQTSSRLNGTLPAGFTGRVTTVEEALATGRRMPRRPVPPEAAAYTIFTSGSTGRPKGVTVPRGAVAALVGAFAERLDLSPEDVLVAVTTLSFDISVLELLLPLATGGRVVVADEATASDPVALRRLLVETHASVLQATPATWRMLLTAGPLPSGLRLRLCGGEGLPRDLADRLAAPGTELWNVYGPTETTVWSAAGGVAPASASGDRVPVEVGPPIPGTRWYLLDDRMRPVVPGAVGEVHIGGAGVTRGYLGRAGLTADRFRPDPYGGDGGRLYATGDLGRWRSSGRIELLGRSDHQVKIRGFRIEAEEIESVLRRHPGVEDAVVVARPGPPGDPGLRLVGHVVPTAAMPPADELRAHLAAAVPDYMVPARFVAQVALPRTPNGKLDRAALPDVDWPDGDRDGATPASVSRAPGTPTEEHLGRMWSDLLGLHRPVGVDDSFFALGGHSLTASQLVARVHAELGVALPLRDLFTHPTIAGQAALVEEHRARQRPERPAVPAAASTAPATARRGDLLAELDALDDDELGELLQTLIAEHR